ncbi:LysM peptidoglycan-binding domain-containing M23 family metallopeptidase, partial [Gorillibacterium massiliense]|uniref:LysM peptidoglycan-binding domain-containing M23 family metallopeptidase n=1 Tax=Gorillibacterium massiliense TaxID=1280390 RepID=UPI0012DCA589
PVLAPAAEAAQAPALALVPPAPAAAPEAQPASVPAKTPRFRITNPPRGRFMVRAAQVAGSVAIIAVITIGSNHYVKANTHEVFHVKMNGAEVGVVNDPQVVDNFKLAKYEELQKKYPDTHMVLNTDAITLTSEKAYKIGFDNEAALAKLSDLLSAHAVGVQLFVDGKLMGTFKDEAEVNYILESIKSPYEPAGKKKANSLEVKALSADMSTMAPGSSVVEKVDFVQKVETKTINTKPDEFDDKDTVLKTLQTGNVRPKEYNVIQGDTLGGIAQKYDISIDAIYKNNPDIKNDFIKEGQSLNLTVLQPALTVQTVEKVVEKEEVHYGTKTVFDASLKQGVVQTVTKGKPGSKTVTIELTKVNGEVTDEKMVDEEITTEPVQEVIKRGTKVIRGEGTGNFAWPVLHATITSGFGSRWGKLHKGVDLISSNRTILAADNGVVTSAGYRSDYGKYIIIDHNNGYKTLYGHLSRIDVTQGQTVEKGDRIGIMGSTGDATGTHLHFEIIRNESVKNPLSYLNR